MKLFPIIRARRTPPHSGGKAGLLLFSWNFPAFRGKGTTSPAQLGLRLVRRLPKTLTRRFQVMVLADTAFGSVEFLQEIRHLRYHAVVGVRRDRKLVDGRKVSSLYKRR
ncbi:MAG: transposase [Aphanothece sp. CMT-3BRIN-NPC111]|nr:transposase [Aphanothece sp. CMT-3BRIN-NPC111]